MYHYPLANTMAPLFAKDKVKLVSLVVVTAVLKKAISGVFPSLFAPLSVRKMVP